MLALPTFPHHHIKAEPSDISLSLSLSYALLLIELDKICVEEDLFAFMLMQKGSRTSVYYIILERNQWYFNTAAMIEISFQKFFCKCSTNPEQAVKEY